MFQSLLCMNAVFYACGMHSLRLSFVKNEIDFKFQVF